MNETTIFVVMKDIGGGIAAIDCAYKDEDDAHDRAMAIEDEADVWVERVRYFE